MRVKLSLKKWILKLLFLLIITGLNGSEVIIKADWKNLDNKVVHLNELFHKNKVIHILVFRVIDCSPCVKDSIRKIKKIDPNAIAIVGYVKDAEVELLKIHEYDIQILPDINYQLIRQLRLRKTPVHLTVDNSLRIIEAKPI